MQKCIPVDAWDFGMTPASRIKISSRGLTYTDQQLSLVKRAAFPGFAEILKQADLQPGEIPIHILAIGATERYGANRNGDGFCLETCRKRAHTFVSHPLHLHKQGQHNGAKFYRHHKNKDPRQSYGYVKASHFNPEMARIELLVIANGTKEAAARNGGLVLPDSTLEKLAKDIPLGMSMACTLPFDVCVNCLNKAANRQQYCTEDTCRSPEGRKGLGCRHNMAKISADGLQQYVENPDCSFFDISEVVTPADRIAYGMRVHQKAATASLQELEDYQAASGFYPGTQVRGGAALAEWYQQQHAGTPSFQSRAVGAITKMAAVERAVLQNPAQYAEALMLAHPLAWRSLQVPAGVRHSKIASQSYLQALGNAGVVFGPADFFKLAEELQGHEFFVSAEAAAEHCKHVLPMLFSRLKYATEKRSGLSELFGVRKAPALESVMQLAAKEALHAGVSQQAQWQRLQRVAGNPQVLEKFAQACAQRPAAEYHPRLQSKAASEATGSDQLALSLAMSYGLAKAAAAAQLSDDAQFERYCELTVLRNLALAWS